MKTALVIGATGVVGQQLVELLIADQRFSLIKVFTRRNLSIDNPKLEIHLVDFGQPELWQHLLTGDVLFSSLGSTIKKAGSKENQYRIDYLYQYQTASFAAANGVPTFVLVSSMGANPKSNFFYPRMKGELERDVKEIGFQRLAILQPSILDGNRIEKRFAEHFSVCMMQIFKYIPGLWKYRPIQARIVAQAMINLACNETPEEKTVVLQSIFEAAVNK
jgi:uncharacterized protein YbjT (DUF2867 family)